MAENGVRSTNFAPAPLLDEVVGNASGNTVRQSVEAFAVQLAADGAVADSIAAAKTGIDAALTAQTQAVDAALSSQTAVVTAAIDDMSSKLEGAASGLVRTATWPELAALDGSRAFQPAQVTSDAGSHVDLVSGLTVPNSGEFTWAGRDYGWQRVGDLVDGSALQAEIDGIGEVIVSRAADDTLELVGTSTLIDPGDTVIATMMEDEAGRAPLAVLDDGTIAIAAARIGVMELRGRAEIAGMEILPAADANYLLAITDDDDNVVFGVTEDGIVAVGLETGGGSDQTATGAVAIVPGDTALNPAPISLYVGGGGNLTVLMQSGATVTLTGVPAGTELPITVTKVLASTTATNIIGLLA